MSAGRFLRVAAAQFPVTMDVAANLAELKSAVSRLAPGTVVVAPEGVLSGYQPRPGLPAALDARTTQEAISVARGMAEERALHLIVGACVQDGVTWRNSSFYLGPQQELWRYDKVNLANSERGDFAPGDALPVLELKGPPAFVLGIQMCREIRYPEQWRVLAARGAQVFAYVNNAVGSSSGHETWRAHAISRAAELQRYLVGANNAAPDQTCPSLIVDPAGRVLAEAPIGATAVIHADLDLSVVSNAVLDQAREDVVRVVSEGEPAERGAFAPSA